MLKAPWRRFLDTIIQTCLGRQDFNGVLGKQNDLLGFLNGQWGPVQLSSLPGGNIGLDFVFAPGQAQLNNRYPTEATLWTAVNAALLVASGPLTIAVDSSAGAATFAVAHNYANRVSLVGNSGNILNNILTIADGALQTDIAFLGTGVWVKGTCTTGPAMAFSAAAAARFNTSNGAALQNLNNAHAMIDIPAGQTLTFFAAPTTFLIPGGVTGTIFGLPTATSHLVSFIVGSTQGAGITGLGSGVALSTWQYSADASLPANVNVNTNFAGVLTIAPLSYSDGVLFSTANQTAFDTALETVTAQQAIDMHYSPSEGIGANYIVDHNQLDQCMEGSVAAIVYTIPVGFPIGRELTFIDASGGAGGNAFTLTPTAPEQIGAAGAGMAVVYTQAQAKALTIKKTQANTWRVISSTTLV